MKRIHQSNKATYGNVYANKPIFRRKLIEKYSTARYNFNTKFVLKKILRSSSDESCQQSKRKYRLPKKDECNLGTTTSKKDGCTLSNGVYVETGTDIGELSTSGSSALTRSLKTEEPFNERDSVKTAESHVSDVGCEAVNVVVDDYSKRATSHENVEISAKRNDTVRRGWKIAPKKVYDYLWETSIGKCEIKQEPKKEVKKRKKGHRKKSTVSVKNRAEQLCYATDPYVDCWNELENLSELNPANVADKVGIVMYLGVNRPLFPLIYRNIRLHNGGHDSYITDFWSEFALSTLITQDGDKKCTPVLVSVKDPELYTVISKIDESCAKATLSDVSVKADVTACDNDVEEEKCAKNTNCVQVKMESSDTVTAPLERKLPAQRKQQHHDQLALAAGHRECESYESGDTRRKNVDELQNESISVSLSKKSLCMVSPTSTGDRVGDESQESVVLKQYGYKECVVAIPKLGDAQIRAIFDGNDATMPRTAPQTETESEQSEEHHFFGAFHCSRTYGIMIDYIKRNRTLVYYYKLKKMLDFQKTNNKYFMCCDYALIDRVETQDDVDVTSYSSSACLQAAADEAAPDSGSADYADSQSFRMYSRGIAENEFQPRLRCSRNPNDIFNYARIKEFKDRTATMSSVKTHELNLARDWKWIALKLDKSVVSVCYANQYVMRHRLLFEVVYRAELTKKIICSRIEPSKNVHGLAFGVYAFPGICEFVYFGPYAFHENHRLSGSVRAPNGQVVRAQIKTIDEKENLPQPDEPFGHIDAKWWWPNNRNHKELNEQYLQFVFNPSAAVATTTDTATVAVTHQVDKFNLSKILSEHSCLNYHTYEVSGKEQNFVLFHDLTNTLQIAESANSIPAKRKHNVITHRDSSSYPCCDRGKNEDEFDEFEQHVNRKRCRRNSTMNNLVSVHTIKNGVLRLRKRSQNYRRYTSAHIENERMRRLEFRNNKLNLASELRHYFPISHTESLVSIIQKSTQLIKQLECDTFSLIEQGKMLRKKQTLLMKKYLFILKRFDPEDVTFKRGMDFISTFKRTEVARTDELSRCLENVDKQLFNTRSKSKSYVQRRNGKTMNEINKESVAADRNLSLVFEKVLSTSKKPKNANSRSGNRNHEVVDSSGVFVRPAAEIRDQSSIRCGISRIKITQPKTISKSDRSLDDDVSGTFTSNDFLIEDGQILLKQPKRRRRQRQPWTRRSKLQIKGAKSRAKSSSVPDPLYQLSPFQNTDAQRSHKLSMCTTSLIGQTSTENGPSEAAPVNSLYLEHSYSNLGIDVNSFQNNLGMKYINDAECGESLVFGQIGDEQNQDNNFRAVVKEKSTDQVSIDIMENSQIFARLNIAKVRNQDGSSSSNGINDDSKQKIFTLMTRILAKMQQSSAGVPHEALRGNDVKSRLMKRALLVRKLKSLIGKFEENKRQERMYENVESVEISDDEFDSVDENNDAVTDSKLNTTTSSGCVFRTYSSNFFENAELHESEEEEEIEENESDTVEEQVIDGFDDSIYRQSISALTISNSIENIVIDDTSNEYDSQSINSVAIRSPPANDNLKFIPVKNSSGSTNGVKKFIPILSRTNARNVVIYPKHKRKFIPNIIKVAQRTTNSDNLIRLKIKSANASSVDPSRTDGNVSGGVKRTWCSPISSNAPVPEETNVSCTEQQLPIDVSGPLCEANTVTDESETSVEKDESNTRICIKPFACVGKFDQAFSTNVDKLLNPL